MVFGTSKKLQDEIFCLTEERDYFQTKFLEQVSEIAHLKGGLGRAKKEIDRLRKELMARGFEMNEEDDDDEEEQGDQNEGSLRDVYKDPMELMSSSPSSPAAQSPRSPGKKTKQKNKTNKKQQRYQEEDEEKKDDTSELTADDDDEDDDDDDDDNLNDQDEEDDEDKEANDIRQSAEKLLQWASYRSLTRTSVTASTPEHLSVASPRSNHDSQSFERSSTRGPTHPRTLLPPKGGIPSSVELDAALDQGGKDDEQEEDDVTFGSTASSDVDSKDEDDELDAPPEGEPQRRGKKLLQKFENLVTNL